MTFSIKISLVNVIRKCNLSVNFVSPYTLRHYYCDLSVCFKFFVTSFMSNDCVYNNVCFVLSLAGCPEAALSNVLGAVQVASQTCVLGVIVALWSGPHHLTPYPFAWPGFVVAAGLSWNTSTHWVSIFYTLNKSIFMFINIWRFCIFVYSWYNFL